MKKNKISFEAENPFKVIATFFDFAALDFYKQHLSEAVIYSYKTKVYEQDNPSNVFVFYTAVCSLLKACYCLQKKSKKWKMKEFLRSETVFHLTSLTEEEYDNPFTVFQKAFDEKTPEQFELFLSEIVGLSLSPQAGEPDADHVICYIYLIKMLDAVELIRERGVEKIRKRIRLML
ncbi:hypothetical protein D3C86_1076380 [compost metagenome]